MSLLPIPAPESIFYEDDKVYCCLAKYPLTSGHSVVVWKANVPDLHILEKTDYEYLMDRVNMVRNALIKVLNVEKVYLLYLDESRQVHWHLVPRFNESGYNILMHDPKEIHDFSLAKVLSKRLEV
jgi:diadenosine tetraphosphate (Ap4A) HIT family hydrolase